MSTRRAGRPATPIAAHGDGAGHDDAVALLGLAARLHAARGRPDRVAAVIDSWREWLGCSDALALTDPAEALDAGRLEAIAGGVTHCVHAGVGACGSGVDPVTRARCRALAPHLHEAAIAARALRRAALFDESAATWIIDRDARVLDANAAARAVLAAGRALVIDTGCLAPAAPGGLQRLRRALAGLTRELLFTWPAPADQDVALRLRVLPDGCIAATYSEPHQESVAVIAARLAARIDLPPRQCELAAHLLLGHRLSDAAREMGISRSTANGHRSALRDRFDGVTGKSLLARLRAAAR